VTSALLLLAICGSPEPVKAPRYGDSRLIPLWDMEWSCDYSEVFTPNGWKARWYYRTQGGLTVRHRLSRKTWAYYPTVSDYTRQPTDRL
jgi:hypothetical protein